MPTLNSINWPELYKLVHRRFTDTTNYFFVDEPKWIVFMAAMAGKMREVREYAISVPDDIEPLWATMRLIPHAPDILTYAVSDLTLELPVTWETLASLLAQSLRSILPVTKDAKDVTLCVMDQAFAESFASNDDSLTKLLADNRWLILLMLLRRAGTFLLFTPVAVSRALEKMPEPPQAAQPEGVTA